MKLKKSLILASSLVLSTNLFGANGFQVYGGMAKIPLEIKGYRNAVLNDEHRFPSNIGVANIKFDKANTSGSESGITIGAQFIINKNQSALVDMTTVSSGNIYAIGYKYSKPINDKLSIGVIPKFGFADINVDLGGLKTLGSLQGIETIDRSKFKDGDKIETEASGTVMSLEIEVDYSFTKEIAGFFKLGYQKSSFKKPTTKIGGSEVTDPKAYDEGVYGTDGILYIDYNSNIDPFKDVEINMDGMILSYGVSYKF
jgi:hypothetical protein